jgi:hypothetical protein
LIRQGLDVYVVDNWSTDATYELAKQFLGRGVIGMERFPAKGPSPNFDLMTILKKEEQLSQKISADWFIHHDCDEIRSSPWPGINLREGIFKADQAGFNCIDHTVILFHPIDNNYVPGTDFEQYFNHFEFSNGTGDFTRINAWKNTGKSIALAGSGGHKVSFEGARVYPYKFLMKHYPVRSQPHGQRKVFLERKARWNPDERAKGMHVHYDHIKEGHLFLRDPGELEVFEESRFISEYTVERLTGIGALRCPSTRISDSVTRMSDNAKGMSDND